MLKRKLTKVLENWLKSGHDKALLLTGARQVGKTTAVREFAGKFYKHFVALATKFPFENCHANFKRQHKRFLLAYYWKFTRIS